jgi:(1->4)-alpha-D-glucan 1-alpha-D-glucosylmutase
MTPLLPAHTAVAPISTYRLQLTEHFTLHDAAGVVGYLAQLGIGALYLSPILRAAEGSPHGYDVVDHSLVDPARGGREGLHALSEACREAGLSLVVDIVPNHMGVADATQNDAWWEVLRLGRTSPFAAWFDVDWAYGEDRVLLPVLADDAELERDLSVHEGELRYGDHRYPLRPDTGRTAGESAQAVHERQHYELMQARRADTDQNYRRFFAIADLAGLRVENDEVRDVTHREIRRWVDEEEVTGLRVDHPDGLAAPGRYLERLAASAPDVWVVVEKITQPNEELTSEWPVAGMTGYDALAQVNAVFIDPGAESEFDRIYRDITGDGRTWTEHVRGGKHHVASTILCAEIRRLARLAPAVTLAEEALLELVIAFPVYRSYMPEGANHLRQAADLAIQREPHLLPAINELLPRLSDPADEVCIRFQQTTSAVMAKGVEDTAFYRYSRLIGLNEVGSSPGQFGLRVADFHAAQVRRAEREPYGMTTLSTHDTKRGEDLRARLAVLAELPEEWAETASQLQRMAPMPNAALGYLLWQSLVATGLIERERVHAYAEKSMREASEGTRWADPDAAFEEAVHAALDSAYDRAEVRALLEHFATGIDPYGWSNSLAQKLVQLTMPGVPDLYQGSELFNGSLVDPDNRRPVDFSRGIDALNVLEAARTGPAAYDTPLAKLWVTRQALHARRDLPHLFVDYRPLLLEGAAGEHLIAFDRGGAITLATRLPVGLRRKGGWGESALSLPDRNYRDALTDEPYKGTVDLGQLFRRYPVALLLAEPGY